MFAGPVEKVRRGQTITASLENEIIERLLNSIVVVYPLVMTRQGGNIVISLASNPPQIVPKT